MVLWATLVQGGEVDTHAECSRPFLFDHDWVCESVGLLDLADESRVLEPIYLFAYVYALRLWYSSHSLLDGSCIVL